MEAMADVAPITCNKNETRFTKNKTLPYPPRDPESEILRHLNNLIKNGSNFVVSLTPEYIEGTACNVPYEIAQKLHRGDFSIQDHIDLHGYVSKDAYNALNVFLKKSVLNGVRAVLIIHGRGLSSPGGPVLKNNIIKWLTSGKWRKWVLAFASARRCDGGTGGTYVLLRNRPIPKRLLRKQPSA
jgi:DNA-nicking Smr family endonuclease